ncbi:MAG: DUF1634 domain-containing protein [Anaerolineae bacterium]|nr:DUF1634 domain-containing protein [Anaerolineae bacterium]MDW8099589.1 DUF1634 domain-containing protein [Anaerolineae bacterium]
MKATRSLLGTAQMVRRGLGIWFAQRWAGTVGALWRGVSARFAQGEKVAARVATRDLNEMVHWVLVVGLLVSAFLMLVGLTMELWLHRSLPATVVPPAEAIRRAISLHPSGFLSLGLLTLILTPLLRVVGSLIVFAWERDGRYVVITGLVLIVMLVSLWVGQA